MRLNLIPAARSKQVPRAHLCSTLQAIVFGPCGAVPMMHSVLWAYKVSYLACTNYISQTHEYSFNYMHGFVNLFEFIIFCTECVIRFFVQRISCGILCAPFVSSICRQWMELVKRATCRCTGCAPNSWMKFLAESTARQQRSVLKPELHIEAPRVRCLFVDICKHFFD